MSREQELGPFRTHAHREDEFEGDDSTVDFLLASPPLGKRGDLTINGQRRRSALYEITDTLAPGRTLHLNETFFVGDVICFAYAY